MPTYFVTDDCIVGPFKDEDKVTEYFQIFSAGEAATFEINFWAEGIFSPEDFKKIIRDHYRERLEAGNKELLEINKQLRYEIKELKASRR